MRPWRIVVACLIGGAALSVPPARAEEKKGTWEAGFLFGNTFFSNEFRLANELQYGIRFGWYWKPSYEWEFQYRRTGSADLQDESSTLIKDETVFFSHPGLSYTTDSYSVRFLINPRNVKRRLKPYAVFGYGVMFYREDPKLEDSEKGNTKGRPVTIG